MREPVSVIVSTAGRESLGRMLDSVMEQEMVEGDEVVVVTDGKQEGSEEICKRYPFVRCIEGPKSGDFGHTQMNIAVREARNEWLLAQDDDDVFVPGSWEFVRAGMSGGRPFWMESWVRNANGGYEGWGRRVDGHSLVVRRDSVGVWGREHHGDQAWMDGCCEEFGGRGALNVFEEILSWGQPGWRVRPVRVRTGEQVESLRQVRNEVREWMTGERGEISAEQQRAWWAGGKRRVWVYEVEGEVVGYGMWRWKEGKKAVSYGLRENARGKRFGREVMWHILLACQGMAWAEVAEGNEASLRAHESLGWERVGEAEGIVMMAHAGVNEGLVRRVGL